MKFSYSEAAILTQIRSTDKRLCTGAICLGCPASLDSSEPGYSACRFLNKLLQLYPEYQIHDLYKSYSDTIRPAALVQYPPDLYPELYL